MHNVHLIHALNIPVVWEQLKTLHNVGAETHNEMEREVATLSSLAHSNIVTFHGVCHDTTPSTMVFEYMQHGDLNNYLR